MTHDECIAEIDRYYADRPRLREILLRHSEAVAALAVRIVRERSLPLDCAEVHAAAMLHDIGIIATDAPGISCFGTEPYIRHGVIGASMLRGDGVGEEFARVAERHTGAGISDDDIAAQALPLPPGRYMPETLLERVVCYADKFYSKTRLDERKSLERVRAAMARFSADSLRRFDDLHRCFSIPGLD